MFLLPEWNGLNSCLSKQALDAKRVSIRVGKSGPTHPQHFDISVDGFVVYRAYAKFPGRMRTCALAFVRTGPDTVQTYWFVPLSHHTIPMRSIAYAISAWYANSAGVDYTHAIEINCHIALECEIRTSERWATLYAKGPLLRVCKGETTYTRNRFIQVDPNFGNTKALLSELYEFVAKRKGKKIHFKPIV